MNSGLIYVYCISNRSIQLDQVPVDNLKCFVFGEYYVLVKNVSPDEFSEENLKKKFADLSWIEKNARDHIEVISQIMKSCTVIPFKFGTIYKSEESVGKFISDYSVSLEDNLINIEGKEEWSVKIYCDSKVLNEKIAEISEEVLYLEQQIRDSSQGKGFILKIKKNELIKKEVEKIIKNCGQTCYDEFKNISELSRINNLLPKELTERSDDMILNTSFFIKKQRVADFVNAVDLLQGKYNNIGFDIDVSGPWPPSFVKIKEIMTRFESNTVEIKNSPEKIYSFLSDLNNFKKLMPEQVINWKSTENSGSFTIKGMTDIYMRIAQKEPFSKIIILSGEKSPFNFSLRCLLMKHEENVTSAQMVFNAELNATGVMLASEPLHNLVNILASKLKEIGEML